MKKYLLLCIIFMFTSCDIGNLFVKILTPNYFAGLWIDEKPEFHKLATLYWFIDTKQANVTITDKSSGTPVKNQYPFLASFKDPKVGTRDIVEITSPDGTKIVYSYVFKTPTVLELKKSNGEILTLFYLREKE